MNPKDLKEFNLNNKTHQEVYSGGEETRIKIVNAFKMKACFYLPMNLPQTLTIKDRTIKAKLSEVVKPFIGEP